MINPINITQEMLPEQVILECHRSTATPSLIVLFLIFAVISFLPYFFFDTKAGSRKYLMSWIMFMIITAIVLMILIFNPLWVNEILGWFR